MSHMEVISYTFSVSARSTDSISAPRMSSLELSSCQIMQFRKEEFRRLYSSLTYMILWSELSRSKDSRYAKPYENILMWHCSRAPTRRVLLCMSRGRCLFTLLSAYSILVRILLMAFSESIFSLKVRPFGMLTFYVISSFVVI